ncbi:MAG: YbjN domain-containing protein [Treponema sp.]|nr:YbjN domain-containing protein [Treponema sp.]
MADNKIEQYLIDLMLTYQQVDDSLWLLDDEEHVLQGVAIVYAEPLVVIRAEIMDIPKENLLELYTRLLGLNATDVVHGAYAVDNDNKKIILINTLQYDSMDYENFRAALESFSLALAEHYPILSKYREKSGA